MIGRCKTPLLAPETDYERFGFRDEVIFPGGMILEDDGEVKIYYGAADTVEALATAHVDDLLALSAACLLTALRGKRGPQESVLLLQLSQELTCLFQVFIAGGD